MQLDPSALRFVSELRHSIRSKPDPVIPSSGKSTFMSPVSALFCSEPTMIMTSAMVYMSVQGGIAVSEPQTGQHGVLGKS